jgi:hypothetical protein
MNTNRFNREGFTLKTIPLRNDDDRHACLKLLTLNDKHLDLCHGYYTDTYINTVIENSSHFLFYHTSESMSAIVAFALVQVKRTILDIFLLCAVPSDNHYGNMMAYSVYNFAIHKQCTKLYVSPRTATLRRTFMKYGFEHLRGIVDIDEVLVKYIHISSFVRTSKTFKRKKYGITRKSKLKVNNTNRSVDNTDINGSLE